MERPAPIATASTRTFYDGCAEGVLRVQRCGDCRHTQFYPRLLCSACGSRSLAWIDAAGTGRIKSFTIIRRAVSAAFEGDVPYVVALVTLDEGPTLMANVIGCSPEEVSIGRPVRVTFERRGAVLIPQFELGR